MKARRAPLDVRNILAISLLPFTDDTPPGLIEQVRPADDTLSTEDDWRREL